MRVNTNVSALIANNQMGRNVGAQSKSMEKLSSGVRIKRAADDAAGLAISEKMRAQLKGLDQAGRNVQDGISVVQTAEGALEETGNILTRMRTLSVQASNETNNPTEREKITNELKQLNDEVARISSSTEFNGKKLLNKTQTVQLQVGANNTTDNHINVDLINTSGIMSDIGINATSIDLISTTVGTPEIPPHSAVAPGGTIPPGYPGAGGTVPPGGSIPAVTDTIPAQTEVQVGTKAAQAMIGSLDDALGKINTARAQLGAQQNRLESTQNNLNNTVENVTAAESRIRDTDVASEMVTLSKMNILVKASQSMLAQANQQPQGVLQLLG